MDKNNQNGSTKEPVVEKKRKSRFGMVVGVLVIILAITFAFLARAQKDSYRVLDNSSKEVTSKISEIKDIRTLKGYKVLEDNGKCKLVLISAGLAYDAEGKIEVSNVDFEKDNVTITVKETINKNPEIEKVTYPFVIVKVDTVIDKISVLNTDGEKYEEIFIDGKDEVQEESTDKDATYENVQEGNKEDNEEDAEEASKPDVEEDLEEKEDVTQEEVKEENNVKTLTCVFQGRVDANSIEVSVGDSYRTFDVTRVQNSFNGMEIGQQITVEYIDVNEGQQITKVK